VPQAIVLSWDVLLHGSSTIALARIDNIIVPIKLVMVIPAETGLEMSFRPLLPMFNCASCRRALVIRCLSAREFHNVH
jgi:hypothetical protein